MFREELEELILGAVEKTQKALGLKLKALPEIVLERPSQKAHGDFSTNIALVLGNLTKTPPLEIAQAIKDNLEDKKGFLAKVEVAPPGFINFFLDTHFLQVGLKEVAKKGSKFGRSKIGKGQKIQIEFVSANPVGPLHLGHGRWAVVGDTLARVMEAAGFKVQKEFYLNDYGRQFNLFGKSVTARYLEILGEKVSFPAEGYHGKYIYELAQKIIDKEGERYLKVPSEEREEALREKALTLVLRKMDKVLKNLRVDFSQWFSESILHSSGVIKKTLSFLERKDYLHEKEGALWFRSSKFGDEKDRVLIRENGEPTYFAADIAYHQNKLSRGFEKLINIWGADHHGYVSRMKAAIEALGYDPRTLEVILGQLVNLYRGKEKVVMSQRTGETVTLEELLEEVGKDAVRYFFLSRATNSPLDFDIELAKEKSEKNPIYYVQYAHARISSLLKYAKEQGVSLTTGQEGRWAKDREEVDLELLKKEEELDLIRKLFEFEELVEEAVLKRAPHLLPRYSQELATSFHFFYQKLRVIGNEDKNLDLARLHLVNCTQIVLKNTLNLMGISAPEKM